MSPLKPQQSIAASRQSRLLVDSQIVAFTPRGSPLSTERCVMAIHRSHRG
jgi:hypothetical protein